MGVVVGREVARMHRGGERGERTRQGKHCGEQLLWMSPACLEEVPQERHVRVDRVQQPEVRYVGDAELREALILLTAPIRKEAALGREELDQAAGDRQQVVARRDVDIGRQESQYVTILTGRR